MPTPPPSQRPRQRPRLLVRIAALGLATVVSVGLAEIAVRTLVPPGHPLGAIGYATADGKPIKDLAEGAKLGFVVPVPQSAKPPRPRFMFAPNLTFHLTYQDNDVLARDWFDERGWVATSINSRGLRERESITLDKPAGQRRIVCVGDSFTFGWGIPAELGWARLLEKELRKPAQTGATENDIRTVNCGAAGTVCIDEYVIGLEQRFVRYQPDCVLLTICLNDLIPSSGLTVIDPVQPTGFALLDLARGAFGRSPLQLDPERDWVAELLALPADQARASMMSHPSDKPFEAMWSQGVPQKFLRRCKAYCKANEIRFGVILWPFLQELGEGQHYPFQKLHDFVAADCAEAGIPFLDVLPMLHGTDAEDLWVTPADPHPNPLAQRLALPAIVDFTIELTDW
ncbi:MAG: SGNH/GDSL hydrolase family protein [Planctomycetota bacterium]